MPFSKVIQAKTPAFAKTDMKALPDHVKTMRAMQPRKAKKKMGHSVIGNPGITSQGMDIAGV